jgi:hypothetical protein
MHLRIAAVLFLAAIFAARGADASSPLNPAQRNETLAPGPGITPDLRTPADTVNSRVQEDRVAPTVVERKEAILGSRRAPVETGETRDKTIVDKDVRTPETIRYPMSPFDHQSSARSTKDETKRPPTVAKYQDSLDAASASNMARFPALNGATTAKINRFIFRKNTAEPDRVLGGAPVTPAAGGSSPVR